MDLGHSRRKDAEICLKRFGVVLGIGRFPAVPSLLEAPLAISRRNFPAQQMAQHFIRKVERSSAKGVSNGNSNRSLRRLNSGDVRLEADNVQVNAGESFEHVLHFGSMFVCCERAVVFDDEYLAESSRKQITIATTFMCRRSSTFAGKRVIRRASAPNSATQ